ncbi:ABC transporter permease [Kitasatospora sp. GP82]|uniref:ABC transporter permease n=1 Tax=Kitasatospora sp. GP82 TaxID=3035089 RepID=UPI002475D014|nr:ABC transporter permease [Kitasatospora sp. GP82]MDH6128961.1 ABC-2 type transport system permease protein [Kitasatospora sp. GP82]
MSLPPEATANRTAAADSGVIHNIGYRSYQGPRLGRSYATRSLFVQSLRAAYGLGRSGKSKVLPVLVLGALAAPALVIVAYAILQHAKQLPVDYPQYLSTFSIFIEIFLAAQAPVLMSRDLRYQTVPLYFSRPITRGDYVRAKFGAMVSAMLILMAVPLLVLYLGSILGGLPLGHNTGHLLYGLVAAVLYAVLYSALGLLIAASTPRRGFGVAAIMGALVVSSIFAGVVFGLSGGLNGYVPESAHWSAVLSPSMLVDGLVNQVFGLVGDPRTTHAPGALGVAVFAVEIAALVVGSYWLMLSRYRKI